MTTHRTTDSVSRRTALAGISATGLGLALAATTHHASAQDATPNAMAGHLVVGTWLVLTSPPGPLTVSFHADGTCTFGIPIVQPAAQGVSFTSTALGMWEPTGERTMHFTAVQWITDAAGNVTGSASSAVDQTVSEDGQTFVGHQATAVITIRDAAYNVVQTIANAPIPDAQGIRIGYARPGFPEATPTPATPTS
jgi:hypothetical protein